MSKVKPSGVVRSGNYDQTKDKYWLFSEDEYTLADFDYDTIQDAIDAGDLNLIEVYDVVNGSDGINTTKVGNRNVKLDAGEQKYTANVKTSFLFDNDFTYYTDRGVFVISECNCIRYMEGNKAIPLNDVYEVEKGILNTGSEAKFNGLEINIDSRYSKDMDETKLEFSATALVAKL